METTDCTERHLPKVILNKHTPLSKATVFILFQKTSKPGPG